MAKSKVSRARDYLSKVLDLLESEGWCKDLRGSHSDRAYAILHDGTIRLVCWGGETVSGCWQDAETHSKVKGVWFKIIEKEDVF